MQFHIANMACGGCAESVTTAIRSVDPDAGVTTDPARKKVEVSSGRPRALFETALAKAGYPPAPAA